MSEPQIMIVIPARGGSKGIPRKALQMLHDKPVIAYTILDALGIKGNRRVCVNTDDPEIREVSLAFGADVPFLRPAELAGDRSDLQDVMVHMRDWFWKHEKFSWDVEIVMFPTYPFRRPNRINAAVRYGLAVPSVYNICSAVPLADPLAAYMRQTGDGWERFFTPENIAEAQNLAFGIAMSFNIIFHTRQIPFLRIPCLIDPVEGIDLDEWPDMELARRVVDEGLYPLAPATDLAAWEAV